MSIDSRDVTLFAVFAALYVIVNVIQSLTIGNPTIYGPVQLRIADCLLALAVLFGWPLIGGVTFGCVLTNWTYFLGTPDVILGPIANLVAATIIFLLRKRQLLACIVGALPIGIIVGTYLPLFFPFLVAPEILSLPAWAAWIISLTISSLIAVSVVGYSLLLALSRSSVLEALQSRGLKVVDRK